MKMSKKRVEALINAAYCKHCSGVQINIMDIGKVFKEGERLVAAGNVSVETLGPPLRMFVDQIARAA